jgi:hypothetical protein
MNKWLKILVIFLLVDVAVVGGYFGLKALKSDGETGLDPREEYEWVMVDDYTLPSNSLMEFIKVDGVEMDILPIEVRNYGKNAALLKKFRGSKFVGPKVSVVEMSFQGLEDWALVDLRTKNEEGQEIGRTVLYVLFEGRWRIGDSGRMVE